MAIHPRPGAARAVKGLFWLPPQASDLATRVDIVFFSMLALTATVALVISIVIVWFAVRYRRGSKADRSHAPANALPLEIAWSVIPLPIFLCACAWGATLYADLYRHEAGAMPIFVVGKQWMWKLQHENGRREINELHLPLGQPVRLVLATEDAIHSFYLPAFRIKQDAVPGRYTSISFTPAMLGTFDLRCAEYCGTDHSHMDGRVIVMRAAEFSAWLSRGPVEGTMAERGRGLFRSHGCSGCHDARSTVRAPALAGLYGRVVHLEDGRDVTADEAYLRDALLLPGKDVVAGFAPVMPSFKGQLSEEEILDLIAYLKVLKDGDA
jgi:cytochrome c oxidase subunit 2